MTMTDAQILEATYSRTDVGTPSVAARADSTVRALRKSGWPMARIRAAAAAAGWAPELVGAPGEPSLNARALLAGTEQQRNTPK